MIHTTLSETLVVPMVRFILDKSFSNSRHVCTAETLLLRRQLLLFQLLAACTICISNNRLLSIPIYETNPEKSDEKFAYKPATTMVFQGTGQFYPRLTLFLRG
jgi:hypothetical protein